MPFFVSVIAPGFKGETEKLELAIVLTRITFPFLLLVSLLKVKMEKLFLLIQ